ncbi:MAG TPA: nucleotidyltransferase family protein [Victivallales bacterium]|nr:nucleotidyltransferase family protein [Victivallales bacterium]
MISVFDFAKKQHLQVLVYTILRRNKIDYPGDLSLEMEKFNESACVIDIRRRKQLKLKETIQLLNVKGIEYIRFKGSALANTLYRDSFCRLMCDIDILMKSKDGVKAFNLLGSFLNVVDQSKYLNFLVCRSNSELNFLSNKKGFSIMFILYLQK